MCIPFQQLGLVLREWGNTGTSHCDGLCVHTRSVFTSSAGASAPWSPCAGQSCSCAFKDSFCGIYEGMWMSEVQKTHVKTCCWSVVFALFGLLVQGWICSQSGWMGGFSPTPGGFCILGKRCDVEKCSHALGLCFSDRSLTAHFSAAVVQGRGHWPWGRKDEYNYAAKLKAATEMGIF